MYMAAYLDNGKELIHAKSSLGANGRIVIPAAMREQLGIKPGDTILMEAQDGVLRIESVHTRIARIQQELAPYAKPGILASDELIAERREEARREDEEFQRSLAESRLRNEGKIA
jgi:AbrB family looped-hinge helix DNA binding protein